MKTTKKTVLEVEYDDLDIAITDFLKSKGYSDKEFDKYGYESIQENNWGNYQCHTFPIDGNVWSTAQSNIDSKDFKKLSTNNILNWMCRESVIEPGEYLVNVSW